MDLHLTSSIHSLYEKEESLYKTAPDEIIPHLFISNFSYAEYFLQKINNPSELDKLDSAILACCSSALNPDQNTLFEKFYISTNFKHLLLTDSLDENISQYFDDAYQFIEMALNKDKDVLVFCMAGVSRSASIVIAYLQKKYNLSFEQAFNHVSYKRPCIDPNRNYIAQLKSYHTK